MKKWKLIFACFFVLSLVLFLAPIPSGQAGRWGLDKLVHLGIFAALLLSSFAAFRGNRSVFFIGLLIYGPFIEILQKYIFVYRSLDYRDMLFDFGGLAVGYLIYKLSNF